MADKNQSDGRTFNLTEKELKAAKILVQSCLDNMGGERPADLEQDEFTWVDLTDLTNSGLSRFEAAGLMSSLNEKGFIEEYNKKEWVVATEAWRWLDTVWDN